MSDEKKSRAAYWLDTECGSRHDPDGIEQLPHCQKCYEEMRSAGATFSSVIGHDELEDKPTRTDVLNVELIECTRCGKEIGYQVVYPEDLDPESVKDAWKKAGRSMAPNSIKNNLLWFAEDEGVEAAKDQALQYQIMLEDMQTMASPEERGKIGEVLAIVLDASIALRNGEKAPEIPEYDPNPDVELAREAARLSREHKIKADEDLTLLDEVIVHKTEKVAVMHSERLGLFRVSRWIEVGRYWTYGAIFTEQHEVDSYIRKEGLE